MASETSFDPAEQVKKFRTAATGLRRLTVRDQSVGTTPSARAKLDGYQHDKFMVADILRAEGRRSLIRLLEVEADLMVEIADAKLAVVDVDATASRSRRLRSVRADIQEELDPTVVAPGQAKDTLAAIQAQFGAYVGLFGEPKLHDWEKESQEPGCWSINWEEGPENWTMSVGEGGVNEARYELGIQNGMKHRSAVRFAQDDMETIPHGVGLSPFNHIILYLYPES